LCGRSSSVVLSVSMSTRGHFRQGTLEDDELLILQSRNKCLEDPACMHGYSLGQASPAGSGQGHHGTTCVGGAVRSNDKMILERTG
jgi:hypothetical protein